MLLTHPLPDSFDLLSLQRLAPARYPLLLESSAHGTAQGRWDLLLVAGEGALRLDPDGTVRDEYGGSVGTDFFAALDARWQAERVPRDEPRWPFRGGWALLLGYEAAAQVEPILRLPRAEGRLPVALALRCPAAVLRDHTSGECVLVLEIAHESVRASVLDDVAAHRHQAFGRGADHGPVIAREHAGERRGIVLAQALEEFARLYVAIETRAPAARQVGLEHIAGAEVIEHAAHAVGEALRFVFFQRDRRAPWRQHRLRCERGDVAEHARSQ